MITVFTEKTRVESPRTSTRIRHVDHRLADEFQAMKSVPCREYASASELHYLVDGGGMSMSDWKVLIVAVDYIMVPMSDGELGGGGMINLEYGMGCIHRTSDGRHGSTCLGHILAYFVKRKDNSHHCVLLLRMSFLTAGVRAPERHTTM
jgi:hypothetical protein